MDQAAESAQLVDEWNAATEAERIAREKASTFYHEYLRIRR